MQSAALAAQVNALSEGGRCTAKQVRKYFKRRRAEDRCEAIKAERMGGGVGVDGSEGEMVLGAVVEPESGSVESSREGALLVSRVRVCGWKFLG